MQITLENKLAIVTGSTTGIGLGITKGLARAGASVVVNGRQSASVERAMQQVRDEVPHATVHGFAGDLGTAAGCEALVREYPTCQILVNNLGIYGPRDIFELPDEVWTEFFEVNVMSGVRLSRAYAPAMADAGWGRIVFISSESAINIPADMIHYGVSKTSQLSLARGLAKRLAGTGVTVNAVLPGPTLSEGFRTMLEAKAKETGRPIDELAVEFVCEHRSSSIPRRPATVEEVANMVVYTCSAQASATTGAALRVDGGVVDAIV